MFDAAPCPEPSPPALQQCAEFARALTAIGTPCHRSEDHMLVLRRRFGPVTAHMITRPDVTDKDTMKRRLRAAKLKGPVILAPDRPMPLQQIGALPLVSPATLAVLDLTPDLDALMRAQHPKWRNRLRHSQRQGLRVTRQNMPDDATHWLLDADEVQRGKRRYTGWPRALTLAYVRENPSAAKLFTAHWGREPVAAMLFLRFGQMAVYHIGHTRASGRITSAHTLLLWSAIVWARSKGLTHMELGTINTEDAPGLARFKLGAGAQPHRLGGTWLYWPPLTAALRPLAGLDCKLMDIST